MAADGSGYHCVSNVGARRSIPPLPEDAGEADIVSGESLSGSRRWRGAAVDSSWSARKDLCQGSGDRGLLGHVEDDQRRGHFICWL